MPPRSPLRIWMGWDASEARAYDVAVASLNTHARRPHGVRRLAIDDVQRQGFYTRPTRVDAEGHLFDVISDAPMSTGHAIARFLVPFLCGYQGWALFVDGDVLFRDQVEYLFELSNPRYAVQVVKHAPMPELDSKKDGHVQTSYARKCWSSVVLFNCSHPANRSLTRDVVNMWAGRDLHAFKWLQDHQIGELPAGWNYLVGVTEPRPVTVHMAHFTLGTPDLPDHGDEEFSDEWHDMARRTGIYLSPDESVPMHDADDDDVSLEQVNW